MASVFPTELTSSGTHSGSMSRSLRKGLRVSYSTPRAVCASMMAVISWLNTGTKRSAVVNVNA